MNGYMENRTGYVEYKNMPPACLGYVKVEFQFGNFRDLTEDNNYFTGIKMQPMVVSPHVYGREN
jgi:hypothetical protein